MSDHADADETGSTEPQASPDGVETVEAYETEGGVVFYDAENPTAWLEATRAVTLREQA